MVEGVSCVDATLVVVVAVGVLVFSVRFGVAFVVALRDASGEHATNAITPIIATVFIEARTMAAPFLRMLDVNMCVGCRAASLDTGSVRRAQKFMTSHTPEKKPPARR